MVKRNDLFDFPRNGKDSYSYIEQGNTPILLSKPGLTWCNLLFHKLEHEAIHAPTKAVGFTSDYLTVRFFKVHMGLEIFSVLTHCSSPTKCKYWSLQNFLYKIKESANWLAPNQISINRKYAVRTA